MTEIAVEKTALSPEHAELIRQTLPVVGANIGDITPNFYRRMFGAHPELLADTFNRGNQKIGAQQKALAASVATFAATLVDPEAPDPVDLLARIGHKHVSVGIVEEQYPIVHKHLFDAIEEILTPEVFSGEVRAAWDEVYLEMQRVLVDFERGTYREMGVADGDVFRDAEVVSRTDHGDRVVRFGVRLVEGETPGFRPGQYISVRQTMPDGARQLRQYSLTNAGGGVLEFAVRREDGAPAEGIPAGEVSTQLWRELQVGDVVEISLPAGDLVLDTAADTPVVLISAGIGVTPMLGMLDHLVAVDSDRRVLALHADRSEDADVLRSGRVGAVEALAHGESRTWYEPDLMDLSEVDLPEDADYYLCGSNPFLQAIRAQLTEAGIDKSRVHFELFSPNDWLVDG
ncbi:hemin transporter [Corynebacterium sphenisci DSM 44792]|uniref:nitric oxide dioxygenase n=1 Tax=Corynebacterium sphenisci DSM 44792 TaxID=1437874 RepID=A0A1L7D0D6_9CORY|nr:globin domain-containing protein [Corynebacterium sphenisci]APT91492.1 hemin transporter [Corynebacterium sphenisci DSM 44792]